MVRSTRKGEAHARGNACLARDAAVPRLVRVDHDLVPAPYGSKLAPRLRVYSGVRNEVYGITTCSAAANDDSHLKATMVPGGGMPEELATR